MTGLVNIPFLTELNAIFSERSLIFQISINGIIRKVCSCYSTEILVKLFSLIKQEVLNDFISHLFELYSSQRGSVDQSS